MDAFTGGAVSEWEPCIAGPSLAAGEAHVWRIAVPSTMAEMTVRPLLSPDEWALAGRFRFERDRVRYLVTHTALRQILSQYLGAPADALQFTPNSYGKPYLSDQFSSRRVEFNLSHSGQAALLAVSVPGELGVDIEHKRADFAVAEIAERFFAPREANEFRSLPEDQRVDGFYNAWTRKEAYIKARGMGLAIPLDSFHVTLAPGQPASLEWDREDPHAGERWRLAALDAGPQYAAALCVPKEVTRWRQFAWLKG